jgi:hypothetical protein
MLPDFLICCTNEQYGDAKNACTVGAAAAVVVFFDSAEPVVNVYLGERLLAPGGRGCAENPVRDLAALVVLKDFLDVV